MATTRSEAPTASQISVNSSHTLRDAYVTNSTYLGVGVVGVHA